MISSDEREVREWNVVDAKEPRGIFSLDRGNANAVDYSADGTFVYASGRGGTALRRWDLTGERGYVSTVPTSSGWGGQFGVVAADGQRSVVLADGGWVLSDYRTGRVGVIPGPGGFRHTYGAFHPDGQHFATAAGPGSRCGTARASRPANRRCSPPGRSPSSTTPPTGAASPWPSSTGPSPCWTVTRSSGWARPSRWVSPCRGSSHARTGARLWCSSAASQPPATSCSRAAAGRWSTWSTGSWCDEGRWR